MFCSSLPPFLG